MLGFNSTYSVRLIKRFKPLTTIGGTYKKKNPRWERERGGARSGLSGSRAANMGLIGGPHTFLTEGGPRIWAAKVPLHSPMKVPIVDEILSDC